MKFIKHPTERTREDAARLRDAAAAIIDAVATRGDDALREFAARFDRAERTRFRVSREEIEEAWKLVSEQDISDMRTAHAHIEAFARRQREALADVAGFSPAPGISLSHRVVPVDSCCCYVPGGSYPLFSTALMLVTPAKAAGVPRVAACSPANGSPARVAPRTLVALDIAGADEIYAVGGAQAVAAFAYGTEQIARCSMIVGPGNAYVTEAKRQCFGRIGIDFIAGPSEVMIIADASARADVIAADVLAQCEHDTDASGVVVSTDASLCARVIDEVERRLATLPTAEIARAAWERNGSVIEADSLDEAIAIANDAAPEHLELHLKDAERAIPRLHSYGSLFVGHETAEVFGDYASGTNHTLPTMGAARYTGGVWVGTFLKTITHQVMTKEASARIAPLVARMARGEGLEAHARAAEIRTTL